MPTFAILGATGTIGGLVLKTVLESTPHEVHCYVRSQSKLLKQIEGFSANQDFTPRLTFYEGDMSNIDALQSCLEGTEVVYLCAAAARNAPNCRIAQDQAEAVIQALRNLQSQHPDVKLPKLVMLSSAETEEKFTQEFPWFLSAMLFRSNSYIYNDLIDAERYLRGHADLVNTVYVKPGGLSHDISRGHVVSEDKQQTFLSFVDLAGGMAEIGETAVKGNKWDGKVVSVYSPGGKAKVELSAIPLLLRGLLIHFFPWLYTWIP